MYKIRFVLQSFDPSLAETSIVSYTNTELQSHTIDAHELKCNFEGQLASRAVSPPWLASQEVIYAITSHQRCNEIYIDGSFFYEFFFGHIKKAL